MIMIDMNNLITEPFIRDAKRQASKEVDLEKGKQVLQSNYDFGMEISNKQIQEVEIQVDKLYDLLLNMKTSLNDANEESKSATKALEIKAIKKRMEKYINEVGKTARNASEKLQVITIDNLLLRQMPGCQKGTASDRARMNMTSVLTRKLKKLMIDFETLHEIIEDEYREVVERRVIPVMGTRPEELVISTVEEIQERHDDAVEKIEKRLSELRRIYLKTTDLVEGQAKILDNMENQTEDAVSGFRSRTDAIPTTKSSQKKAMMCIMMVPIIWLLVVLIVIYTVLSG